MALSGMDALGKILEEGIGLEGQAEGAKGSTHHTENQQSETTGRKKSGSVIHHFKVTDTRTREGVFDEAVSSDEKNDKQNNQQDDDNQTKGCCCFGRFRTTKGKK